MSFLLSGTAFVPAASRSSVRPSNVGAAATLRSPPAAFNSAAACCFSSSAVPRSTGYAGRPDSGEAATVTRGRGPSFISASWNDSYDGRSPDFGADRPWDVLGLGQAIVDFSATVSDDFLESMQVAKGGRRVITVEERGQILSDMEGDSFKANAGGSLSNSLVALARLGRADAQLLGLEPLRVGLGGPIGADALGAFYKAKIEKAGVEFISEAEEDSATGTVVVLTTPDAQRSFLSYPGTSHDLVKDATSTAVSNCRILVIEGYLWEMPGAWEGIKHAITKAKESGTIVVMSAGDAGVVQRHRNEMVKALELGVDVMFTNAEEAAALADVKCDSALDAARVLGSHSTLGIVTDGSKGAYLAGLGEVKHVEPHWALDRPVDTCGAGDAFAAGVLYGLLNGFDLENMGSVGARVASAVISRYGARLKKEDALQIVRELHAPFKAVPATGAAPITQQAEEISSVVPAAALTKSVVAEQKQQ